MSFTVHPVQKLKGSISLPASKSYSIRAWFVAACFGAKKLVGLSDCDDARVAKRMAAALGAKIIKVPEGYQVVPALVFKKKKNLKCNVGESGTSLRFLLPLLPFYTEKAIVEGKGTLVGRPNKHLCETLRHCGMDMRGRGPKESVPIRFSSGEMLGGKIEIDGSVSSQFISALMIAAPLAVEDTHLILRGDKLVSQDYVTMTMQILDRAGLKISKKSHREFLIQSADKRPSLKKFIVPSDYGLAAFFMVAGALCSSQITLKGYFDDTLIQSDGAIVDVLKKMGLKMTRTSRSMKIKGPQSLKGGVFSLKSAPDLVPIMAVVAMFAKGQTRLVDIAHARVKESDRISDLRQELLKVGADIQETEDALIINPKISYKMGMSLNPHSDHRLAMAFAVLGLKIGVTVQDMRCCAKSYPQFVSDLKKVL